MGHLHCSTHVPTDYLLITKERKWAFTVGNPGGTYLNQGIKILVPVNRTHNFMGPDMMPREGHSVTSGIFLPQIHGLNLIMRKHQTNPNWGRFYKTSGLYPPTMSVSRETKTDWGRSQMKGDWAHGTTNVVTLLRAGKCCCEGQDWDLRGIWTWTVHPMAAMLATTLWVAWLFQGSVRECHVFRTYILKYP